MAHDVFISHARQDKAVADAVCAKLEHGGIRCWIAPRDIEPGADWGESLLEGLKNSRILVLVLSASANASPHIRREVERAVHQGITVVPLRIEDVLPEGALEYHLGTVHWLDAMTPPLEAHLTRLVDILSAILARVAKPGLATTVPAPRRDPPVPQPPLPQPPVPDPPAPKPTPPQPAPIPKPRPIPAKPVPADGPLSERARLLNMFIAPRKTFLDLRRNPRWWVPYVVISITTLFWIVALSIRYADSISKYGVDSQLGFRLHGVLVYAIPIADLIFYFLLAAIWFRIFKRPAGPDLTFERSLAVVIYSRVPTVLADLLGVLVIFGVLPELPFYGSYFVPFIQKEFGLTTSSLLIRMVYAFDVFAIWSVVLTAFGLAWVSKLKRLTALWGVFGVFVVYSALRVFLLGN